VVWGIFVLIIVEGGVGGSWGSFVFKAIFYY
jgi:hypothetical protein